MTSTETRPDVPAFVADVRTRLADLTDEQRDDLLEGLEADLVEQVVEGGPGVLADPASYAAELRAAAGLPARASTRRWPRVPLPSPRSLDTVLDRARVGWQGFVERHRLAREAWSVAVALRPAWWALRAWVLVTILDQQTGTWEGITVVPHLGTRLLGPAVLLVAVVVSVLVGQGRLWPGTGGRNRLGCLLVLVVNVVAVLAPLNFATESEYGPMWNRGYQAAQIEAVPPARLPQLGLGPDVSNIFAYDLTGQPLDGVQLFDQDGDPVAVLPRRAQQGQGMDRTVGCPWFNGTSELFNVFPLQERTQRRLGCRTVSSDVTGEVGPIQPPAPPLAQVSPVTRTAGP